METIRKEVVYKPAEEIITNIELVELFNRHIYWVQTATGKREPIPSVTTQLGAISNDFIPRLRGDLGNREADARMNEAGRAGTRIHYASYIYTKGGVVLYDYPTEINVNPELRDKVTTIIAQCNRLNKPFYILRDQNEYMKFLLIKAWHETVKPVVHFNEVSMGSIDEFAAGTIDKIIEVKETQTFADIAGSRAVTIEAGLWVYDEKNGFYDSIHHQAQTGEYLILAEKNLGEELKGTIIVHTKASTRGKYPGLSTYVTPRTEALENAKLFKWAQGIWLKQNPNWKPEIEMFNPISMRPEVEESLRSGEVLTLPDAKTEELPELTPDQASEVKKNGKKKKPTEEVKEA